MTDQNIDIQPSEKDPYEAEFDETASGVGGEDGDLTSEGERLVAEHYNRIERALQEWASPAGA